MTDSHLSRTDVVESYREVRDATLFLCEPLEIEDFVVQSMADVSPPKWHLAHTTWFFESFLLAEFVPGYEPFHLRYHHLFNSYYETVGPMHPRPQRGLLSRPTVAEVYAYREHVDDAVLELIGSVSDEHWNDVSCRVELGLHHEQQHQELLLTDIKHILYQNPLRPAYRTDLAERRGTATEVDWHEFGAGVHEFGHSGGAFAFDNERPVHAAYVADFRLAGRSVTNGEWLQFMADGGYARSDLWLADGWKLCQRELWHSPLYWEPDEDGSWSTFSLAGMGEVRAEEPVVHISYYEADAFARWSGKRLPTEYEWELAARDQPVDGNLVETGHLHPCAPDPGAGSSSGTGPGKTRRSGPCRMFGDVWEWTQSSYAPYPGFRALAGSLGEYNGKFMCNQYVLRGGSCATPRAHLRPTYRNFYYPSQRWNFQGLRLADGPD